MTKTKTQREQPTRLGALMRFAHTLLQKNEAARESFEVFRSYMYHEIPELEQAKKDGTCAVCDASIMATVYHVTYLDGVLLMKMFEELQKRMERYNDFTFANQIKIHDLDTTYAVKSRTTIARYHGLVAKLKNASGRHVAGTWVITKRGFEALRGLPVQEHVVIYRGQIYERAENETTTLEKAFNHYGDEIRRKISKGKAPNEDYRTITDTYSSADFVQYQQLINTDF